MAICRRAPSMAARSSPEVLVVSIESRIRRRRSPSIRSPRTEMIDVCSRPPSDLW
jgi:hypothetical protein